LSSQFSFAEEKLCFSLSNYSKNYSIHHSWMKVHTIYHFKSSDSAIMLETSNQIARISSFWGNTQYTFSNSYIYQFPAQEIWRSFHIGSSLQVTCMEVLFCWLISFASVLGRNIPAEPRLISNAVNTWNWGWKLSVDVAHLSVISKIKL
jgi:hypothetical protein